MRVVICGAGTAGCILAARLSEDPGCEVVLLESGPHYRRGAWPPELSHSHRIIKETHDWGLQARAGLSPRLVHVPRGRVVGGSSVTNGAIALRGHPEHYDEWSDHVDGFGWDTWLPWFRAIERDLDFGSEPWHGDRGPIPISRYARESWHELQERFVLAALEAGHPPLEDHNRPGALGIGPVPLNMIDGRRQTPVDHYLDPALERPNLALVTGVEIDRIELSAGRARAVHALGAEGPRRWEADAVIVSLGSYASPAALLRSGIGAPEELAPHGIPLAHELPGVGRGLQDHPKVSYRFELGIDPPEWPAPWYQVLLTGAHEVDGERRVYQVMPYSGLRAGGQRYTDLNIQLADARSRHGAVRLASADPREQPAIDMGWLLDESDRRAVVAAGRRLRELAGQGPLAEVLHPWPSQDDDDHPLRVLETFHHPVGTCRMGRGDDDEAVVDARGAVRGLEGLHVIDASVIPRVPSANCHLAVIALSERLAAAYTDRTPANLVGVEAGAT